MKHNQDFLVVLEYLVKDTGVANIGLFWEKIPVFVAKVG